ncbi:MULTISPECIES: NAD(P)-dependent oxidoreductase [unclassified Mycobacterium]|uniref:NAD(P)-dependent oxidoreductase n=1 Tax=unclassified Mycobacterium TaxID=2642494 RepID=UPI0029C89000|nr:MULTISPECIES: NAD(P)-binding domain-containing protein [unclassified Mycobacterium]
MSSRTIGFIGIGRLGLPLAKRVIDAGFAVITTKRGRSDELVRLGGCIPGNGSPRAVAENSHAVVTCMPSVSAFEDVLYGAEGILSAVSVPPLIEVSTLPLEVKLAARRRLLFARAGMIDAPISGSPAMVEHNLAMIYASGDRDLYLEFESVLHAMSPDTTYVGSSVNGSKYKVVAQTLSTNNATAAVDAVAFAQRAGLDLAEVAELIADSPGAASEEFRLRAQLIAASRLEGWPGIGSPADMLTVAAEHYHRSSRTAAAVPR